MGVIRIDFSALEAAVEKAGGVADSMDEYAEKLPQKVVTPLGSLTGGASSNTSLVAQLAQDKAKSLRSRAEAYESMGKQITAFVETARAADAAAAARIKEVSDAYVEKMNLWEKICYSVSATINGFAGKTIMGKLMSTLANALDVADEWITDKTRDLYNWFKRGNGRYVLNVALGVIGTVAAIAGAVLAFPVSGVVASLVAGCALVSAAVAVADGAAAVLSALHAFSYGGTEPGVARYYGSATTISEHARKNTTSAAWQNITSGIDFLGDLANVGSLYGGLFTTSVDGVKVTTTDWDTVMGNIAKKFGLSKNSKTGSWSFSWKTVLGIKDGSSSSSSAGRNALEGVKEVSSRLKGLLSSFQTAIDLSFECDDAGDVIDLGNDLTDILKGVFPGLSGYDSAYDKTFVFGKEVAASF